MNRMKTNLKNRQNRHIRQTKHVKTTPGMPKKRKEPTTEKDNVKTGKSSTREWKQHQGRKTQKHDIKKKADDAAELSRLTEYQASRTWEACRRTTSDATRP